jgi:hypothetical protein
MRQRPPIWLAPTTRLPELNSGAATRPAPTLAVAEDEERYPGPGDGALLDPAAEAAAIDRCRRPSQASSPARPPLMPRQASPRSRQRPRFARIARTARLVCPAATQEPTGESRIPRVGGLALRAARYASRYERRARRWQRHCEAPHEHKPAAVGIALLLRVVAAVAAECPFSISAAVCDVRGRAVPSTTLGKAGPPARRAGAPGPQATVSASPRFV